MLARMVDPEAPEPSPRRRVPTGALVLVGSVLASLIWYLLMPAPEAPQPESAPEVVSAPAPEPGAPAPAAEPRTVRPRAPAPAREEAPPPPPPPPASSGPLLRVRGDVEGADVFIDRTFVGKTPFETRAVTAGPHQINVSAPGYDGVSERVTVAADEPTEMVFSLKAIALDAAVPVVHKHAFGSCQGQLTATLDGLRYRPREGGDGFFVKFDMLEQFDVQYQEKQLRVKIRNGRTFNFTTEAPSADPLFVFHRDVEQARAKVKAQGGS